LRISNFNKYLFYVDLENQTLIKVCKLERNNQKVKFIRSQLRALL